MYSIDPATNLPILIKHLSITGLNVYVHYNEWPVAFAEMNKMIANVNIFGIC